MTANITKKLAGKVALVTGGSRGIGAAIAKRLAADGAAVALTYSASPAKADEVVRSMKAAGGKALAIKADAADTEAVRLAVAKTIGTFGGIDILVNNAGVGVIAPIEQFSLDDFDKLMAVNVRGLFVATQEAARHLREGGRIIHIGSTNSERMPFVGVRSMHSQRQPSRASPGELRETSGRVESRLTMFSLARLIPR